MMATGKDERHFNLNFILTTAAYEKNKKSRTYGTSEISEMYSVVIPTVGRGCRRSNDLPPPLARSDTFDSKSII